MKFCFVLVWFEEFAGEPGSDHHHKGGQRVRWEIGGRGGGQVRVGCHPRNSGIGYCVFKRCCQVEENK